MPPEQNMAVDEVLINGLELGTFDGFLRFYRWSPPSFSFGYFQRIEKIVDPQKVREAGFGCVRRRSGGKMVFHADEWTFSVGSSIAEIKKKRSGAKSFIDYFKVLLQPLLATLRDFGIQVDFKIPGDGKNEDRILCYSTAAGHSVFVGDKKMIGAAGFESKGNIIVHGTLPISPSNFPEYLFPQKISYDPLQIAFLNDWMTSEKVLELPHRVFFRFFEMFDGSEVFSDLTESELSSAKMLAEEKYSNLFWPRK